MSEERMIGAPERIFASVESLDGFGHCADASQYDGFGPEYIRADLHEAQLAVLRDKVEALTTALRHIDAMDPEERMIDSVCEQAAKGILLRMGEVARETLKVIT